MKPSRLHGFYLSIGIIFFVWMLGRSDMMQRVNGWGFDRMISHAPVSRVSVDDMLLVSVPPAPVSVAPEHWDILLQTLNLHRPRLVVFAMLPASAPPSFFETAGRMEHLIFGLSGVWRQGRIETAPVPWAAEGRVPVAGIWAPPAPGPGFGRIHAVMVETPDGRSPHLVTAAAEKWHGKPFFPTGSFHINSAGLNNGLPRVSMEQVVSGNIVPRLIEGRCIVIAPDTAFGSPAIPFPGREEGVSPLEFHAMALHTLIHRRPMADPGPWAVLAWITLVSLFSLVLLQVVPVRWASGVTVGLTAMAFGVSWIGLGTIRVWIPPMDAVLAIFLVALGVTVSRTRAKDAWAGATVLEKSMKIRSRFFPESFFRSEAYWSQIIHMVNETLQLDRAIFLEALENDHRVREVISLNCSIDDIQERRRDYHRTPYSTAISEARPIRVRQYLEGGAENEAQFLVVLSFEGQVMGFWAFGVPDTGEAGSAGFLAIVEGFAGEISRLLHQRKLRRRETSEEARSWRRIFDLDTGIGVYRKVDRIVSLMERRLTILESVFDAIGTATILYDVFGRVVQINRKMTELLKKIELPAFEMGALDLAQRFTGQTYEEARGIMTSVVVRHETVTLRTRLSENGGTFVLAVRPVVFEDSGAMDQESAYPFRILGVLFEVIDISAVRELDTMKSRFFRKGHEILLEEVGSLSATCHLLEDDTQDDNIRKNAVQAIEAKHAGIRHLISDLDTYMRQDVISGGRTLFPLEPGEAVNASVEGVREAAAVRGIRFSVDSTEDGLVLAPLERLRTVLERLLLILMEDAADRSEIAVRIQREEDRIRIHMENTGFGIPDDDFQALFSPHQSLPPENPMARLPELLREVRSWNGALSGQGDVGLGIRFDLSLTRYGSASGISGNL